MNRQTTISLPEFTNFLTEGAFLRRNEDCFLFWAPMDFEDDRNSQLKSIAYRNFHDADVHRIGYQWQSHLSQSECLSLLEKFLESEQALASKAKTPIRSWGEADKEAFRSSFDEIQKRIARTELRKAVPITCVKEESGPMSLFERAKALLSLLNRAPKELYVYGFWGNEQGVMGATPEVLFERSPNEILTMALAGTKAKSNSNMKSDELAKWEQDFLSDQKELKEHEWVVKDIETTLASHGLVKKEPLQILHLPRLGHLMTRLKLQTQAMQKFEGVQDESSPSLSWMKRLHPTPALGVYPRSYGIEWMQSLPHQQQRGLFGGPLLFSLPDGIDLCLVSIRNIQWNNRGLLLCSGCGVVAESVFEKEWQELSLKRKSVMDLLQIGNEY